jgi:LacI family gluconate utilization system Gnt-I transcriptional repressor
VLWRSLWKKNDSGYIKTVNVARLAGVSTARVSRVLRQPEIVSPALRNRISDAIGRLSYRRNLVAGALASARTMTNGVIIPLTINSQPPSSFAFGEELAGSGYQLMLGKTGYSAEVEQQLVPSFLEWLPAALVVTGRRYQRETARALLASQVPAFKIWELSAVGQLVVRHFSVRGPHRLGFIGAYIDRDYRTVGWHAGFVEAARETGYDEPAEVRDRASAVGGARGLAELIACDPKFYTIFCCSDIIALGALFEADRFGLRVPGMLKICGFSCEGSSADDRAAPRREIGIRIALLLRAS